MTSSALVGLADSMRRIGAVLACLVFVELLLVKSAEAVPFSLKELPSTVADGDTPRSLTYRVSGVGVAAGLAHASSSESDSRAFVVDTQSGQVTLGPVVSDTLGYIYSYAVSPAGKLLLVSSTRDEAASRDVYRIVRSSDSSTWEDVPLPLSEYSSIRIGGVDLLGNTYFGQEVYTPQGDRRIRNYSVDPSGTITELTSLSDNMSMNAVSPSGLISAVNISDSTQLIVNGRTNVQVRTISLPESQFVRGLLDDGRLALSYGNESIVFDPQTSGRGRPVTNLYGNSLMTFASGVFGGLKSTGPDGYSSVTFFNADREIVPSCAYKRTDPDRLQVSYVLDGAATETAAIVTVSKARSEESVETDTFLLTPDFNAPYTSYCSQLEVSILGPCRKYFTKFGADHYKSGNSKTLPATCQVAVELKTEQSGKTLSGALKIDSTTRSRSSVQTRQLSGKRFVFSVSTKGLRSLVLTATPVKASPYLNAQARISF